MKSICTFIILVFALTTLTAGDHVAAPVSFADATAMKAAQVDKLLARYRQAGGPGEMAA